MKTISGFLLVALMAFSCTQPPKKAASLEQAAIDEIVKRIQLPEIPDAPWSIRDFAGEKELREDCKPAIDAAIRACSNAGGGRIVIPPGDYFCKGPIHLLSHVELHLEEGARVTFSQDSSHYLPVVPIRWEGTECFNYSPYIYAYEQHDIALTGKGVFDGNAAGGFFDWRPRQKPDQNLIRSMGREGVPVEERVFGAGHLLRPSFFQPMHCERILVSDLTIVNLPFWVIHPTYCKSVTVRGIRVDSRNLNNDGTDPDSSEDVLIEDCWYNTGDDAIAIKSGRDQDAWRVGRPSRNIVVRNCHAENTLHGVAIGSEMAGGVEQVYVQNFSMKKVDKYALQFKSNKDRGGYIRDIWIDGMHIDSTFTAVFFTNDYHSYSGGDFPTEFQHITIRDLSCTHASDKAIDMSGLPEKPIRHIHFEGLRVERAEQGASAEHALDLHFSEVYINGEEVQSLPAPR